MNTTNLKLAGRLEQCHSAEIDHLFWIAAMHDTSEFAEFLDEIDSKESFDKIFPSMNYSEFEDDPVQFFGDNELYGFLARIMIPYVRNIKFDEKNEPTSWNVTKSQCRIFYAYAEDVEQLTNQIEEISEKRFQEMVEEFKSKV